MGIACEGYAKALCPVDTGRLRNSITHTQDSKYAYVGTNVEYGKYVELGTHKMKAKPYLKPAAQGHSAEYGEIMRRNLQNG